MEINFSIEYHDRVVRKDIPKIAPEWREKIRQAIERKLATSPEKFGKPLRRSLRGYRKLRVGDYRVIFKIDGNAVKILVIQHRSIVYKNGGQL
ncbi:MAG: type II toxin-antitoxin system RelE/ParE family toxin [Patescibacteria group bacterium]